MNILDLEPDILNIIGEFVKEDNERRLEKEEDFKKTDEIIEDLKLNNMFVNEEILEAIYSQLFKNCYESDEINEYIISRNLPLPCKKYNTLKDFY